MDYILQLFEKYKINFNDYIKKLVFLKNNENLTNEFFKNCFILKNIKSYNDKNAKVIETGAAFIAARRVPVMISVDRSTIT